MTLVDLTGKYALVGGGSAGIGLACATVMAEQGATITLFARDEEKLKSSITYLSTSENQEHDYLIADFSDENAVSSTVSSKLSTGRSYDILINNTGGPIGGKLVDSTPNQFLDAIRMHLINNHNLVNLLLPSMKEKKYGRIINIISTSVREPIPGLGVSNTTRGSVAAWAKTLANEIGEFGITVNNILPGFINTGRLKSIVSSRAKLGDIPENQVEENMKSTVPAKRFADPREIGNVCAFLASPAASYVNGVSLPVDGGRIKSI